MTASGGDGDAVDSSAFAFASDLADEGVDTVLANLQERAGVTGVMPAFVYHAARDLFPHNPTRTVHVLDRGAFFFRPDPALYEGLAIQPRVHPSVLDRDVLAETCARASERGMRVHAWTVFLHPDRNGENVECCTRNVFGDVYDTDFCPANPSVRSYVRALASDVARYEVATVVAESLHYHGLEHGHHHERYFVELGQTARYLLGLCFCEHCVARARSADVDVERVREAVRVEVRRALDGTATAQSGEVDRHTIGELAGGALGRYLEVRSEIVTSLASEAAAAVSGRGAELVFVELSGAVKGYADGRASGAPAADIAWRLGVDLPGLAAACPEVEVLGYTADADRLRLDLEAYRSQLGDARLAVALRPSPPDCHAASDLAATVRVVREFGAARLDFYHYGLARLEALDWIREAIAA